MKKLLEELKQLDPACYDEIWQWVLWLEEDSYAKDDPKYLNHRDDVIQGCVQRAMVAREWILETISKTHTNGLFTARIFMKYDEFLKDLDDDTIDFRQCCGDSTAKAILTAYLAARKANP